MDIQRVLLVVGQGRAEESLAGHLAELIRAQVEAAGCTCRIHDLLADGFDPVLRLAPGEHHARAVTREQDPLLARYQEDVAWAEAYVFVHPVWWFAPPAILKGWVDRVLAEGVALVHGDEPPRGLLRGRRALVVQTLAASAWVDRWVMGAVSRRFWSRAVLRSVGIDQAWRVALHGLGKLPQEGFGRFERRLARAVGRLLGC